MPKDTLKHGKFISHHHRFVIETIAIGILKSHHPPFGVFGLFSRAFSRSAGVSDIEAALIVKGAIDRTEDVISGGNSSDLKAVGQGEGMRASILDSGQGDCANVGESEEEERLHARFLDERTNLGKENPKKSKSDKVIVGSKKVCGLLNFVRKGVDRE